MTFKQRSVGQDEDSSARPVAADRSFFGSAGFDPIVRVGARRAATARRLTVERLETRAMLAADFASAEPSAMESVATSADINGDGFVDVLDANQVAVHWLTDNAAADVNDDGVVDIFDLAAVSNQWTVPAAASAAPAEASNVAEFGVDVALAPETLAGMTAPALTSDFASTTVRGLDAVLDARLLDLALRAMSDDDDRADHDDDRAFDAVVTVTPDIQSIASAEHGSASQLIGDDVRSGAGIAPLSALDW